MTNRVDRGIAGSQAPKLTFVPTQTGRQREALPSGVPRRPVATGGAGVALGTATLAPPQPPSGVVALEDGARLASPRTLPEFFDFKFDLVRVFALVLLAATLTFTLQYGVGRSTIYSPPLTEKRQMLHDAILTNKPPQGKKW